MQAEASSASVLEMTRPEDWSSCQDTSGFELSQRLMNFPAMEFWARSRWGGIGTHTVHAASQASDSSVSASGCSLGCLIN